MERDNPTTNRERPKVVVVLSSGGLKPISAVALFEFRDEEKIDIDLPSVAAVVALCAGSALPDMIPSKWWILGKKLPGKKSFPKPIIEHF